MTTRNCNNVNVLPSGRNGERGSAIVIALFVLALVTVFVTIALTRTSAEASAVGNETAESRTFYAAQGSLETMTRNFNKKFEVNLKPTNTDFDDVRTSPVPGLSTSVGGVYTFTQEVLQTSNNIPVVLTGGPYSGLYAKRDNWRLRTTATDNQGVQVQLTRNVLNNLVPIFQFGIFYDDDLEFHPGPRFDFGGRVHSNGSLFMQAGTGVYFSSKVTASNFIYSDKSKNGTNWDNWGDEVFIKNASGTYVQLQYNMGSVLSAPVNGAPVVSSPTPTIPLPTAYNNASWPANRALFDGNLDANTKHLQLPLKLNSDNTNQDLDLVEVIRRGKAIGDMWNDGTGSATTPNVIPVTAAKVDDGITAAERYYNKTGIRISLADKRQRLPGCATATDATIPKCGVRLDGDATGQTSGTIAGTLHGYQPLTMPAGGSGSNYTPTQVNGDRLYSADGKETWIKIETVIYNPATESYDIADITQDMLSLGVTEPLVNTGSQIVVTDPNYLTNGIDQRSVIKLQRFLMPGVAIPNTTGATGTGTYISNVFDATDNTTYNFVLAGTVSGSCSTGTWTKVNGGAYTNGSYSFAGDNQFYTRKITLGGTTNRCLAPFPINMFDTREGLYNDTASIFDPTAAGNYGQNVPWAGVMSMIDVDMANLKKFLDGTWDAKMPTGTPYYAATGHVLRGNDIPQPTNTSPKSGGWVVFVSDRRGDFDFDGEYDMEDVFGPTDNTLQLGEDVNRNGTLQRDLSKEAVAYTGTGSNVSPDIAALFDHKFYRRAVRAINGQVIPGIYDTTTPANTKGFTLASENGVYVLGNYNASGISVVGTPTTYCDYIPSCSSSADIPASIAGDSITILSNAWTDSVSFASPFNLGARQATDTFIRFAMLSGDTITAPNATPNQGGGDLKMNGGVHNFKRFLEDWGGNRLSYSGSLINLFNSHNNTGPFKCCNHVYSPPDRNWVFDSSFLDVNRLPPGTPYFQYVQTTGFQRTND